MIGDEPFAEEDTTMNGHRWALALQSAIAVFVGAILVVVTLDVTRAQVVAPPAFPTIAAPLPTLAPEPAVAPVASASALRQTVVVVGEGRVTTRPSIARLEIGVETLEPEIAAAVEANDAALAQVLASLAEYVGEADIRTMSYNVYPERDYDRAGLAPVLGYRVTNMAQVTVRDLSRLGPILEAATAAGANQIYGVTFDLDAGSRAQAESEARALASASLRAHAEELAALNGAGLGALVTVSEALASSPLSYAYGGEGAGGPTIEPGGLAVVVRLQATYELTH
jgi:uncharacterized protein YggE